MEIKRINPRRWEYKINGIYHTITISEELEHWLNKSSYNPDFEKKIGIIKLDGILIEKILESVINDDANQDYDFGQDYLQAFKMAIQKLNKKF